MKRGSKLSEINIFSVLKSQIYDLLKQKQDDRAHLKKMGHNQECIRDTRAQQLYKKCAEKLKDVTHLSRDRNTRRNASNETVS